MSMSEFLKSSLLVFLLQLDVTSGSQVVRKILSILHYPDADFSMFET